MADIKPLASLQPGTSGVIEARKGKAIPVKRGQSLKLINTHGKQVIDFFAFALDSDLKPLPTTTLDFLSMQHTRSGNMRLSPKAGDRLYSNRRKPIFTVVEDTAPGVHDTLVPACDAERYRQLGVQEHHASCAENLHTALEDAGYPFPRDLTPAALNLWMNVPVQEGGEIPSFKLFENERLLAFLDIQPLSYGHTLVIPKYHGAKLTDIPDDSLTEVLPVAKKIAKAMNVENYNILQNNGKLAHQVVDHVHFHMIPKPNQTEGLGIEWPAQQTDMDKLKALFNEVKAKM
ncbi:MAG: hypothetical protein LQ338_004050 [Usnochroma carphineum]|nr:MAG: hypothetical protein LQ338_004050 [Usnochroma carphineum]